MFDQILSYSCTSPQLSLHLPVGAIPSILNQIWSSQPLPKIPVATEFKCIHQSNLHRCLEGPNGYLV